MSRHDDPALLHDLLDGRLPPDEARELERRIEADPALRRRYTELQLVVSGLNDLGEEHAPDGFADRVLAAVDRTEGTSGSEPPAGARSSWPLRLVSRHGAVAAACVAVVTVGVLLSSRVGDRPVVRSEAPDRQVRTLELAKEDSAPAREGSEPAAGGLAETAETEDEVKSGVESGRARDSSEPPREPAPRDDDDEATWSERKQATDSGFVARGAPGTEPDSGAASSPPPGPGPESELEDRGESGALSARLRELLGRAAGEAADPPAPSNGVTAGGQGLAASEPPPTVVRLRTAPEQARPADGESASPPTWDRLLADVPHRRLAPEEWAARLPSSERDAADLLLDIASDDRVLAIDVDPADVPRLVENAARLGLVMERAAGGPPSLADPTAGPAFRTGPRERLAAAAGGAADDTADRPAQEAKAEARRAAPRPEAPAGPKGASPGAAGEAGPAPARHEDAESGGAGARRVLILVREVP